MQSFVAHDIMPSQFLTTPPTCMFTLVCHWAQIFDSYLICHGCDVKITIIYNNVAFKKSKPHETSDKGVYNSYAKNQKFTWWLDQLGQKINNGSLEIQSEVSSKTSMKMTKNWDPINKIECKSHQKEVLNSRLPREIVQKVPITWQSRFTITSC